MKNIDRESIEQAARIWSETRTERADRNVVESDLFVWDFITEHLRVRERDDAHASETKMQMYRRRVFAWYVWADAGFPLLEVEKTYAAALAASTSAEEASIDIEAAWPAFALRLPRDLLVLDAPLEGFSSAHFDRIWLGRTFARSGANEALVHLVMIDSETGLEQSFYASDLRRLLLGKHVSTEVLSAAAQRVCILARRIVVGALYTLQYTTNFTTRERALKRRHVGRHGPPTHRVTTIGRSVPVDCSPWVRAFVKGEVRDGASPMFQSLVRGHYKRHAVGVGRAHRKVIWIEPYWRGPEDAPILVRSHVLGGGST